MKNWSAFLKDVRPFVPGVSEPMVEHAVHRATQDFCQRTRAWTVQMDPIMTTLGVVLYDMELPSNTELVRLESAMLDAKPVSLWRSGDRSGAAFVSSPDGRQVLFNQAPATGQSLALTAAVRPSESATGADDVIFSLYVEVIARGAVARLIGDPNKQATYEADCERIKVDLWRGRAAIRPRARANFF